MLLLLADAQAKDLGGSLHHDDSSSGSPVRRLVTLASSSHVNSWVGLVGVDQRDPGPGQDVESEVALTFDPVVVLLGQDGSDEPSAPNPSDSLSR